MATKTVKYVAKSNQVEALKPSVLEITYIDATGVNQVIPGHTTATGLWTLEFMGTVGNMCGINARDKQEDRPPLGVSVEVLVDGVSVGTDNNYPGTHVVPSGMEFAEQSAAGVNLVIA